MREHDIAVEVTDVGDRYVLAGMVETGATLGGEQSGHVVDLSRHTTGDGLATALSLLAALRRLGMSMDEAARLITHFPQKLVAVKADRAALAGAARACGRRWLPPSRSSGRMAASCCAPRAPSRSYG